MHALSHADNTSHRYWESTHRTQYSYGHKTYEHNHAALESPTLATTASCSLACQTQQHVTSKHCPLHQQENRIKPYASPSSYHCTTRKILNRSRLPQTFQGCIHTEQRHSLTVGERSNSGRSEVQQDDAIYPHYTIHSSSLRLK
jgi:hypothetical protein